jgi:hypothetical protein
LFLFASVMQAGIVTLGLLGVSPQPPRSVAASRFPVSVVRVLAVEGGMSSTGSTPAARRSTASRARASRSIAAGR